MGELPQFYEGLSGGHSAKHHGFGVIKKGLKKMTDISVRHLFIAVLLYGRVYALTSPPRSWIESYRNWITNLGLWVKAPGSFKTY